MAKKTQYGLGHTRITVPGRPDLTNKTAVVMVGDKTLEEVLEGAGTSDYPDLEDKPSINGVELIGNKTFAELTDGLLFGGEITTQTVVTPDTSCYYIATEAGTYEAFGVTVYGDEHVQILVHDGTSWTVQPLHIYTYAYAHGKFDTLDDIDSRLDSIVPSSASSSNKLLTENERHFKGWFETLEELKAAHTATEGDSAYVKDASPATTWSIYTYDGSASETGYWADSGTDADTSNVQTFASGEEVNEVHIVNDLTTGGVEDVLSAEQGVVLSSRTSSLEDVFIGMGQLVVSLFKKSAFLSNDAETDITALESLLSEGISHIEAVYTQSGTIYVGQSLDDLKQDLVVTAYYFDGTSDVITSYTLDGTLVAGTSTVSVSFGGETTTFSVIVTDAIYYRYGVKFILPYFLHQNTTNYGPATVDGVTLIYTRSKNSSNVVQVSRACYPYFDLLLTKGVDYKWMVKASGLPAGCKVSVGIQYFNQSFKTDGDANFGATHNSDMIDSGWLTSTISDGVISCTYGSETASSAVNVIGARINLRLLNSSDQDIAWSNDSSIDALIIQQIA